MDEAANRRRTMRRLLAAGLLVLAASGTAVARERTAVATFAGGCSWCIEADFDKVPGVLSTNWAYTGGHVANPSYGQVSAGGTGHAGSIKVVRGPAKVSYQTLPTYCWHHVDPTVKYRQFCEPGGFS
jgi:peptide-methionine (S)-S-oxide reductase